MVFDRLVFDCQFRYVLDILRSLLWYLLHVKDSNYDVHKIATKYFLRIVPTP